METKLGPSGFKMAGEIKMGYNKITQLADPTEDSGAVTRRWVRTFGGNFANVNGFTMKGNITIWMEVGSRVPLFGYQQLTLTLSIKSG